MNFRYSQNRKRKYSNRIFSIFLELYLKQFSLYLLNSSSIVYSLHQDITDDQTIRVGRMVTSLNSIRTKVQRALIEDSIISVLEFEDFFIADLMFLLIDSSVLEFTFHHSDIIRSMNQKYCYIDVGDFKLVTSNW